ncbi:MAG TPA: cyclic nucleotide-binding domain-containing protein [Vicinamibacteria bacterium]|nr:cyclic nucleotide-binding domain-containing protein [Vicinamibacteria bacterium]
MAEIHSYMEALMMSEEDPILFENGQVVFSAGERGSEMYIVRTGSVDLRIGDTLLETVRPGGILGELALVDAAPRSATAVAGPDCSLVAIREETFRNLVKQVPGFSLEVMRVMARRLRQSNAS